MRRMAHVAAVTVAAVLASADPASADVIVEPTVSPAIATGLLVAGGLFVLVVVAVAVLVLRHMARRRKAESDASQTGAGDEQSE